MTMIIFYLLAGLVLLYFGAEWMVRGSANIALRAGVPSLVVGLTIVAFGTSSPELAVSVKAGFTGLGDIAVGNVVGSNIFNIAVILGLSALIHPLKVNVQVLRIDTPIMMAVSVLLWILLADREISFFEALFLFLGIVIYTAGTIYMGRKNNVPVQDVGYPAEYPPPKRPFLLDIVLIVIGLGALVAGSQVFVKGAIECARLFAISEAVIGLTIVAAGTSLPELATSIVAAIKGEEDIAIGNIVGSNIFNMMAILGISGMLNPIRSAGIGPVDLAFMTGTALVLLPLMHTGYRIVRTEGALLFLIYCGYLWFLWP